jgi:hypothetical protein
MAAFHQGRSANSEFSETLAPRRKQAEKMKTKNGWLVENLDDYRTQNELQELLPDADIRRFGALVRQTFASLGKRLKNTGQEIDVPSGRDILLLMAAPLLYLIAWVVPERGWRLISGAVARVVCPALRMVRPTGFSRIEQSTARHPAWPAASATHADWVAGRLEQEIQYLRECRAGSWRPDIAVRGREHLEAAVNSGTGAILWVAPFVHSGLVVKKGLHAAGFSTSHLSRAAHGPSDTPFGQRFINPVSIRCENRYLRERCTMEPGKESGALRQLVRRLKRGQLVSITCSYYGRKLSAAPFMGGTLRVAPGAASLAISTGAPLIPVVAVRADTGDYDVVVCPPLEIPECSDRNECIDKVVANYLALVETYVAENPGSFADWPRLSLK